MEGDNVEHTASSFPPASSSESASRPVTANPLLEDPRFQALVRSRRAFSWSLAILMLIVYFAFILTLAFYPSLLGQRISSGSPTTWGIPIGFGMFALTFLLVAVYVWRANTVYDAAIGVIKQGVTK
jgi:uncharacterized membrane protein (DUF485 family)